MSWPNWQTQIASGAALRRSARATPSSLTVSAWCSSMPRSRAAERDRRRGDLAAAPRGRSGGVTTSAGRCGDAASAASTSTAKVEVPRKTVRTGVSLRARSEPAAARSASPAGERAARLERLAALAQDPQRLLALLLAGAVDDQDAVEVVHLVLEHARLEARCLDQDRLAVLVLRADADV